jgi:hypothetical protein
MLKWLRRTFMQPPPTQRSSDPEAPLAKAASAEDSPPAAARTNSIVIAPPFAADVNAAPAPPRKRRTRSKPTPLDAAGQPPAAINASMRSDRSTTELIGLAKGILADEEVTRPEVSLLVGWFDANPEAANTYPGNVLARRLDRVMEDGIVDDEELEDLRELLAEMTGASHGRIYGANAATTLPLNVPAPEIEFDGSVFVFTGRFALGPRRICEEEVAARGGDCSSNVTKKTNYLVVGTLGSRDWYQTAHGRKIEAAVNLRDRGIPLAIVGEDHWAEALD